VESAAEAAEAFPEPFAFGSFGFSGIPSDRVSPLLPFFQRGAAHESVDESSVVSSEVEEPEESLGLESSKSL
jgi:hypothetical protein